MSARYVLTVLILSVAAIGSWYLAGVERTPEVTQTISDTDLGGFYLRTARILGTDDDGQLLYEIEAEFAQQMENDEIELQNVRINYTSATNVPWVIKSDLATISDRMSLLRLSGNVQAISNEGFSGQETEIRAPLLEIDPNSYQAETDSRVQIRIGSRSLTATGMLALLQENRLKLKSNVSGKFVP
ncbi:MAG: LPS export ABC transporter periplasmic protein LptC [Woeseiaceae bacterium]